MSFDAPVVDLFEVCVLGRAVEAPQVRSVDRVSEVQAAAHDPIRHRVEVEPPITDWLAEAYELSGA